jgi:hypothetical protein
MRYCPKQDLSTNKRNCSPIHPLEEIFLRRFRRTPDWYTFNAYCKTETRILPASHHLRFHCRPQRNHSDCPRLSSPGKDQKNILKRLHVDETVITVPGVVTSFNGPSIPKMTHFDNFDFFEKSARK